MNSFSWDPDAVALDGRPWFERASEGRAGVSPARFVCVLPLRIVDTSIRFAAINCHFISKPNSDPWRTAQWSNNMRVLLEVIDKVKAQGYLPAALGDFNKAKPDVIPGMFEPPTRFLTVDRIGVPTDVKATAELGSQAGSNHFPIIANLTITKE